MAMTRQQRRLMMLAPYVQAAALILDQATHSDDPALAFLRDRQPLSELSGDGAEDQAC